MIFNWKRFRPENTFNKLMHNYLFSYFIIFFFLFSAVAERGGTCSKVFKPQYCTALHFNQTFVPDSNQSSYSVLQDTSNYKCSSQFVKKICIDTSPYFTFVREPSRGIWERVPQYVAVMHRKVFIIIIIISPVSLCIPGWSHFSLPLPVPVLY